MGKYFAIVSEETGSIEDGHLCYVGNDSDMELWKVEPGYKLVELTPEEHRALDLVDIVADRGGKETVITAEEVTPEDNARPIKKYKIDTDKIEKYVEDRVKVDVPIEIDGVGGKEIIGYDQKPQTIITEKVKEIEVIKSK